MTYTDAEFERDCASARTHHLIVEDCWYSCPASGDCCNEAAGDECDCGADSKNAALDRIIADRNRWKQRALDAEAREADAKGKPRRVQYDDLHR